MALAFSELFSGANGLIEKMNAADKLASDATKTFITLDKSGNFKHYSALGGIPSYTDFPLKSLKNV